jgi:CheY-like chemotaxis protein
VRRRLVVADNDPEIIDLLVTDMRAEGHEIVGTAEGGEEALRLCAEHRPDILVVDFRMPPGPNGIEVARRLREVSPTTAVILYTNYRGVDLKSGAAALGAQFLLKGNIRALRRAVHAAQPPPA